MNNYLIKSNAISLIDKKIEELIKEKGFDSSSVTTYDLEEDSITSLIEDADTISFLTPNKVIIGKNLSNNNLDEKNLKTLSKYLDNPNSDVLLILVTTNIDARKKTVKYQKIVIPLVATIFLCVSIMAIKQIVNNRVYAGQEVNVDQFDFDFTPEKLAQNMEEQEEEDQNIEIFAPPCYNRRWKKGERI